MAATRTDFSLVLGQRATVRVVMSPPQPVGAYNLQWTMAHRFGSLSGTVNRYSASGYNNVSGINIVNSGQGIIDISIYSQDASGKNPGNFATWLDRLGSGVETRLGYGYAKYSP